MLPCSVCEFKEYLKHCRTHDMLTMYFFLVAITIVEESVWNVSVQLKCSINFCSTEYADIKGLVSHLSSHIQEGLTVTCPFLGCSKTFSVKTSFSSHISRYHRSWNITQISPVHLCDVAVQSFPGEEAHVSDSVPEEIDVTDADQSKDKVQDAYTENLALF